MEEFNEQHSSFDPFVDYLGLFPTLFGKNGNLRATRDILSFTDDDRDKSVTGTEVVASNKATTGSPVNEDIHEMMHMMRELHLQWREMLSVQSLASTFPHSRTSFYCAFCRQNGEMRRFYTSHSLKDRFGKVACPVLRAYVCPVCRATGDEAHTLKYCPMGDGAETVPLAKALRSGRNCSGQKRYGQQIHL